MQQHGWISYVLCYVKKGRFKRFYILCDSTYMAFCTCPRGSRREGEEPSICQVMRTVLNKTLVLASPPPQPGITTVLPQGSWKYRPMSQYAPATQLQSSLPPRVYLLQSHLLSTKSKPPVPQCAPVLPSFSRKNTLIYVIDTKIWMTIDSPLACQMFMLLTEVRLIIYRL